MKGNKIARRYAKSLLLLAKEQGVLDELHNDIHHMREIAGGSRELRIVMRSPIIKKDKKIAIFNALYEGQINPIWKGFIEIITKNNREDLLTEIGEAFEMMYNEERKVLQVKVASAIPLNGSINAQVEKLLSDMDFSEVQYEEEVNPELIGGVVLRLGDVQLDGSVARQLKEMEKELLKEEYKVKL